MPSWPKDADEVEISLNLASQKSRLGAHNGCVLDSWHITSRQRRAEPTHKSLRPLYLLSILISAWRISYFEIAVISLGCTLLPDFLDGVTWTRDLAPRLTAAFLAYLATGIVVRAMNRNRETLWANAQQLAGEAAKQEASEQEIRALVEKMPAALLTLDQRGKVLFANRAAHELLGLVPPSLLAGSIERYVPDLARIFSISGVRHLVRTMVEGTAYRHNGEAFLAHVWVSSSGPPSVDGLTAVMFDASEQLRSREEAGFHSRSMSVRVIMQTYWHETRNLCSAMRVLVSSLMRRPSCSDAEELDGLKSLVDSLEKLAYSERGLVDEHERETASVRVALEHLRIVIEPSFQENQIALHWNIADNIPLVCADHHGLLQVFLNLARNANRALEDCERKEFTVTATVDDERISVFFHNTGPPIRDPEKLFVPFQEGASGSGLGLYVSRAVVRSYGGDLKWKAVMEGCCFVVELGISQFWSALAIKEPVR
jgi:two-component system sensor kinase FixL